MEREAFEPISISTPESFLFRQTRYELYALGRQAWGFSVDGVVIANGVKQSRINGHIRSWEDGILPALALPPASRCVTHYVANFFKLTTTTGQFGVLPQCPCFDVLSQRSVRFLKIAVRNRRIFNQRHLSIKQTSLGAFTLLRLHLNHRFWDVTVSNKKVKALSAVISISVLLVESAPLGPPKFLI